MQYSPEDVLIPLLMYLICILAWALGRYLAPRLRLQSRFVPFLTTGFEAGMLGYALYALLCGSGRIFEFARIDLGQVLFVFTLYKILLAREEGKKAAPGELMKDMFLSPIIPAILLGILMGASGLYAALVPSGISGILDACTDFISAPTSALILISVGYDLKLKGIPWRGIGAVVGLRLAIMAVLGGAFIVLARLTMPSIPVWPAAVFMFLLPPPFVLPVFARESEDRAMVSAVLTVSTLITIAAFAVMAAAGV